MSGPQQTHESPETGPQVSTVASTTKNPRKGISPLRKALAAVVVGAFLLTGTGIASNGFTANATPAAAAVIAPLTHDASAISGVSDSTKALPVVAVAKTEPTAVPMNDKHDPSTRVGAVSIPRFGADWSRYLVEGATDVQVDLPGTDNPNAVADYETAVGHNTGTQRIGDLGNAVLEAHRTPNTFGPLATLQLGDTISITEATTGTVYTYAVTQTIQTLPYKTKAERDHALSAMDPIPFDDASISTPGHPAKHPATKRLLTLTSCGLEPKNPGDPKSTDVRDYIQAELQSVTPGTAAK